MVAFKVKTTAPNNYFVKPKAGVIAAGGSQEIQVTLQVPYASDPAGNNDRFLVQSAACASPEGLSREDWNRLDKFAISEQRLPVAFKASAATQGASAMATKPVDASMSLVDLRAKHEDLVQYALSLEKGKAGLEEELRRAKQVMKTSDIGGGFSLFQVILAVIIAVLVARAAVIFGY
jgi:DNA-directed RNA polymerase I, II, and III subunit RPABC2